MNRQLDKFYRLQCTELKIQPYYFGKYFKNMNSTTLIPILVSKMKNYINEYTVIKKIKKKNISMNTTILCRI